MGFRTVSFVIAVVLPIPVWAKILLIGGAIVLPWTAVTAANAGPKLQKTARAYTPDDPEGDAPPLLLDPATIIAGSVVNPPEPQDPAG